MLNRMILSMMVRQSIFGHLLKSMLQSFVLLYLVSNYLFNLTSSSDRLAMKPLFSKAVRERLTGASKTSRGYVSPGHQMYPLGKGTPPNFRDEANKNTYTAQATSKYGMGSSNEHIISPHGGIEYAREFTVEEQYIGESARPMTYPQP